MTDTITPQEDKDRHIPLRWLADTREQAQKLRIATNNRADASARGDDDNQPDPFVAALGEDLKKVEKKIEKEMMAEVSTHPAWPWMSSVKGVGPVLACKLLGLLGDFSERDNVSQVWAFAGYKVVEGRRQYPMKGQKLPYNARLKRDLYILSDSFIKSRSPYRVRFYDVKKAYYREHKQMAKLLDAGIELSDIPTPGGLAWKKLILETNKELGKTGLNEFVWNDRHIDLAARRYMMKVFLSHLWEVVRKDLGLPTREAYVFSHMGHEDYVSPWEMVETERKAS